MNNNKENRRNNKKNLNNENFKPFGIIFKIIILILLFILLLYDESFFSNILGNNFLPNITNIINVNDIYNNTENENIITDITNNSIESNNPITSISNTEISTLPDINSNIKIDDIPEYSGQIVMTVNNNIPYFKENEITTDDFEYYSPLDELNRGGVAYANISKYTMPPKGTKRGSISYKPTGWVQYLYGENNSNHLYERCHLIAWQLGNENNNKQNLITGTCMMNSAMIEYENIVANWIKEKNNQGKDYHILYRVTPIYYEQNKLATGVEIEAKSVEEDGVCFNKFVYNVQSGFEINYSTGEAKLID